MWQQGDNRERRSFAFEVQPFLVRLLSFTLWALSKVSVEVGQKWGVIECNNEDNEGQQAAALKDSLMSSHE